MDAKIARRLWRAVVFMEGNVAYLVQQGDYARVPLPPYSTDLDESHRVVRYMQSKGFYARIRHDPETGEYRACFTLQDDRVYVWSKARIMPMAICLAALAAFDGSNVTK
jgi:hypothetical protein